ncbi:hypothetical protein FSP39_016460 [Pinctada imbricata]|uniref:E3 ubiquitin-protein ligase n=1 Tax=Pinctada imbricata TaxID=66713 RepID=A0AA88YH66_PINIB|nr:hypothetical protein FSP39_016460 [Pinctada imbricata]
MNSLNISFEIQEMGKFDEVRDGLKSNFPDVFLFENEDNMVLTVLCDSYEAITKIKHNADVLLGRIKVNQGRRRNRFQTEENKGEENPSESHATSRRNRQFMTDHSTVSKIQQSTDSNVNSVDFHTREGILVKVYSASITRLSVDCIVNAANENLMHGGGVAYAISIAAGYEFDRESRDYVRKNGQIPVGHCCTTGAGNLSYKCVIHTVGPRWSDYYDKKQCEKDLQEAVEVTFKEAVIQGCESIAVPAISSGIFGVPKDICVKQYYRAIVSYSQSAGRPIKEIHFVDKDQRMVDCIIKNFKDFFSGNQGLGHRGHSNQQGQGYLNLETQRNEGFAISQTENQKDHTSHNDQGHSYQSNQQTKSYAKVASQHSQSYDRAQVPSNHLNVSCGKNNYSGASQSNNYNGSQKRKLSESVDGEMVVFEVSSSITVRISVGDIIKVEAEAIVCPQDTKCQSKGGVAKAIHGIASKIYKSGEEDRLGDLEVGDLAVLETEESVKWKYVLHTVPPRWRHNSASNSDSYERFLCFTYRAILSQAKECDIRSLAIPVIGFGDSGFHTVVAKNAKVFPEELEAFTRNQRRKDYSLDVHIVCNDKNVLSTLVQGFSKKNFRRVSIGTAAVEESSEGDDLSKTIRQPSFMEPIQNEKIEENCAICMDELTDPQKLKKCGHVFCKECIEQYFSYKPSCPNCGVIYGKITGDQPEGRIAIAKDMTRLPGYGSCYSIKVTYVFMDGKQGPDHPSPGTPYKGMTRSGWLPDNKEGRLVAKLLNVAFTRKLVFTIGRSRTTGNDGVLTWNDIHHKTRTYGGTEKFGYPDFTYIDRVMDELSVKGVTEESADDPAEYTEYSKVFY